MLNQKSYFVKYSPFSVRAKSSITQHRVYDLNTREKFNTIIAITSDIQVRLLVNSVRWIPANAVIYIGSYIRPLVKFAVFHSIHERGKETSKVKKQTLERWEGEGEKKETARIYLGVTVCVRNFDSENEDRLLITMLEILSDDVRKSIKEGRGL